MWLVHFTTLSTKQVLFLETAYFGVLQKCLMCSYSVTKHIKKTCTQVLNRMQLIFTPPPSKFLIKTGHAKAWDEEHNE